MSGEPTELEGVVERRAVLAGTRSEREVPVLVLSEEGGGQRLVRLHLVGDASYTEEGLEPFVGQRVQVGPGTWRNGVLRVLPEQVRILGPTEATKAKEAADATKTAEATGANDPAEAADATKTAEATGANDPAEANEATKTAEATKANDPAEAPPPRHDVEAESAPEPASSVPPPPAGAP